MSARVVEVAVAITVVATPIVVVVVAAIAMVIVICSSKLVEQDAVSMVQEQQHSAQQARLLTQAQSHA